MIEAKKLVVERGGGAVLNRLDLSLEPKQILALIGGNAAGKSTTILPLLGLFPSPSGRD